MTAGLAGALVGLVGGGFRWCLERADRLRIAVLDVAAGPGAAGWLIPVILTAAGAALACLIAQRVPHAAGSGIQHVEAEWRQEAEASTARLVPAKFLGGLIAIGSGLVLGREGPIVHMGAAIGTAAGGAAGWSPRTPACCTPRSAGRAWRWRSPHRSADWCSSARR